jgi:hypothetical protein
MVDGSGQSLSLVFYRMCIGIHTIFLHNAGEAVFTTDYDIIKQQIVDLVLL